MSFVTKTGITSNSTVMEIMMENYVEEAGAIVFRTFGTEVKILLIFSKKRPQVRIFPKGHIESGESCEDAALRELVEEGGVKGELLGYAGEVRYTWNENRYHVKYYLFRYLEDVSAGEEGRYPTWYPPHEARASLPSEELCNLLKTAEEKIRSLHKRDGHNSF